VVDLGAVAQHRMLVLARESRGITQGQLAEKMRSLDGAGAVSQGYVSRAEAGRLVVSGDRLELYARAVDYPARLLCLDELEIGAGPGLVHHRKRQATSASALRRIHALLNLTRIQLRALTDGLPRPGKRGLPHLSVDDVYRPEDAAKAVRATWGISPGPLPSVIGVLEDAGGLVVRRELLPPVSLDSGTDTVPVDAVSACPANADPIMLLNMGTPAERQRFTVAHELGHMIMHAVPHPRQEMQADRFAAELLMPERQIRGELRTRLDITRLLELKMRWRVSMWALLRRARTLGELSDWQYRSLAVGMSSLGYRTSEPAELDAETPVAVTVLIADQLRRGHTVERLARAAFLHLHEFTHVYLDDSLLHSDGLGKGVLSVSPATSGGSSP